MNFRPILPVPLAINRVCLYGESIAPVYILHKFCLVTWNIVLLEKLIVAHLATKSPRTFVTKSWKLTPRKYQISSSAFIIVFVTAFYRAVLWTWWNLFKPSSPLCLIFHPLHSNIQRVC